ncbi:hypothetical protein ABFS82_13G166100 [Erythranthe guttata]
MEKCRRRLLLGATPVTFFLVILLLFACFFVGNILPFRHLSSPQAVEQQKPFDSLLARLVRGRDRRNLETTGFACDKDENSLVCISNQPVIIDTRNNITVHLSSASSEQKETNIKPYALQKDKYLLQYISPVKILHGKKPVCQYNDDVPAVIFSSGISRNLFHEFNDIIIPLYITVNHFQSRVLLILEDYNPSFVTKYSKILSRLSSYPVMDPASNRSLHCFPGVIVGLKYHDNLALNGEYSMPIFRKFLEETYDLKFKHVSQIKKPTIVLMSREKTRIFLNEVNMVNMMKRLGFRVVIAREDEAADLDKFAATVNSCGVLVGAHGAGLTNELFLPAGAVVVQVEPLGLEWASSRYYGDPARAMGLRYLRYEIEPEESSLVEMYGRHHSVVTDPESVYAKGYREVRAVYLQQQNVRVNIVRFRKTIFEALLLVKT